MFYRFLRERRSWIALILCFWAILLLIAWLDPTIPLSSMFYVVFLSSIGLALFLMVQAHRETRFYKQLEERISNLDFGSLPQAERPFEQIVVSSMAELMDRLHQFTSQHQVALEQEKDELVAWIHEVKTPLTALHLIIGRLDNQAAQAALTYEWMRIHLLLDQQLHQKRLPSIENDLFIGQVELEQLLVAEIRTLQAWCIQKGLGFDLQLNSSKVLSDSKWLAFILRQLLSNAVKYSDSGGPDITIRSFEYHRHTILEIHNYGAAISGHDLPRIFDKGFTSTSRDSVNHGATGMGLYLARRAALILRIQLEAQSAPDLGTTLRLRFPEPNEMLRITSM